MRQLFFYVLAGSLAIAIVAWGLYMLGQALSEVYRNWKLGRELDELEAQTASRRVKRQEAKAQRLANGCEHDFSSGAIGLPPNVCYKCGIEKEKPNGLCDHVWRVKPGPVPSSECEQCGKMFSPISQSSNSTRE